MAADKKRRDEADRNAKSKAIRAKLAAKVQNKRLATEAESERRKAVLQARREALAEAKLGKGESPPGPRMVFDGRAVKRTPHSYDTTPRHVIQNDRPLPNQKPRKQLTEEQMRKRREQIAARLSRKMDPAKLHAFAEAKESDNVHIGRLPEGMAAAKTKPKTKKSSSSAVSRTRRSTRTLRNRNASANVAKAMRPFPVADYYQANESALSEADPQSELDLFMELESDVNQSDATGNGEFDGNATFEESNRSAGASAANASARRASAATNSIATASSSQDVPAASAERLTPSMATSSSQIMSGTTSDTDEEHEDQLNAALGILPDDIAAATISEHAVVTDFVTDLGEGEASDGGGGTDTDADTDADADTAVDERLRLASPNRESINLTFFAGGSKSSEPSKERGVRRIRQHGQLSTVSGFALAGDSESGYDAVRASDKPTYSRLELAATRQEAERALAELKDLKAQEDKARNERDDADSTRAAAVLAELREKQQQVVEASAEVARISQEEVLAMREQTALLKSEQENALQQAAQEATEQASKDIAALTNKQTENMAELHSAQQAALDGVVRDTEQEIASLRQEHQSILNSALIDAAAAKAEVDQFLEQQQRLAEDAAAEAAQAAAASSAAAAAAAAAGTDVNANVDGAGAGIGASPGAAPVANASVSDASTSDVGAREREVAVLSEEEQQHKQQQQEKDLALKQAIAEVSQAAAEEVAAMKVQQEKLMDQFTAEAAKAAAEATEAGLAQWKASNGAAIAAAGESAAEAGAKKQQQDELTRKLIDETARAASAEVAALKRQQAEMAELMKAQLANANKEVERLKAIHAERENAGPRLMKELEALKKGHVAEVERMKAAQAGIIKGALADMVQNTTGEMQALKDRQQTLLEQVNDESASATTALAEVKRLKVEVESSKVAFEESQKRAQSAAVAAAEAPTAEDIAAAEMESPYMDVHPSAASETSEASSEAEDGSANRTKAKRKVAAKGKGKGKGPATSSKSPPLSSSSTAFVDGDNDVQGDDQGDDQAARKGTTSLSLNAQDTPIKSRLVQESSRRRLLHDPSRERQIAELAAAAASKAVVAEFAAMEKVNSDRFDAAVAVLSASSGGGHSAAAITAAAAASAAADASLNSSVELNKSLAAFEAASVRQKDDESDVDILLAHLGVQSRLALVRHTAKGTLGLRLSFDSTVLPNGVRVTAVSGNAAESGAIYVDDTIVEVNGISMMDASHSDIVEAIRKTSGNLQLLVVSADAMSKAYAPYAADDEDSDISDDDNGDDDGERGVSSFSASRSLHWDAPYSETELHRRPAASTDVKEREVIPAVGTVAGSAPGINEEDDLEAARELEAINIRRAAELEELAVQKARELDEKATRLQEEHAKRTLELEHANSLLVAGLKAKAKRAEEAAAVRIAAAAAAKETEVSQMKGALEQKASAAETELSLLKAKLENSTTIERNEIERLKQEVAVANAREAEVQLLRDELDSAQKTVSEAEMRRHEDEMVRRKLHHQLQELKGNIRVVCRVRPLLTHEKAEFSDGEIGPVTCPSHADNRVLVREHYGTDRDKRATTYNFDKVFSPKSSQAAVFEEVSQVVQSALDGYNVCIFAYGQTSAGKTYTMEGGEDPESQGIIPRTVREVFRLAGDMAGKGWEYKVQTSFLEIYNDSIRDLLYTEAASGGKQQHEPKHAIFTDAATKQDLVSNLITETVTSDAQVFAQLRMAAGKRASASTAMNARSSRSHSVFRIQMIGSNKRTGDSSTSTLNLVDLAGSERLSSMTPESVAGGGAIQKSDFDTKTVSGTVAAERLRETQNINKSLAALSKVMLSLQKKSEHIPYRDSKLTHVLKNSLGGNSKSIMIVNISPRPRSVGESVCSLRFAGTVASVEKGKLQRQAAPAAGKLEKAKGGTGGKSKIARPSSSRKSSP